MTLAICKRLRWQYVHEAAPEETQAAAETIDALYEALKAAERELRSHLASPDGSPPQGSILSQIRAALTKASGEE